MDIELNIHRTYRAAVGTAGREARDFLSCLATCLALAYCTWSSSPLLLPCRRAYEIDRIRHVQIVRHTGRPEREQHHVRRRSTLHEDISGYAA